MTKKELDRGLKLHKLWIKQDPDGVRLTLRGANLSKAGLKGADLRGADLYGADFYWADLRGADISRADLSRADLSKTNLIGANLSKTNLIGANLRKANLYGADLSGADLSGADFSGADLRGSDLNGAKLSEAIGIEPAPEGELIGWKKLKDDVICKLRIPADAKRYRATTNKLRAEYAIVLDGEGISTYDSTFLYEVGKVVRPRYYPFDTNRWDECASGIHFFLTKEEAEQWQY